MNWIDIVSKIMEQDGDTIQLAPLSNISGADIKFDKGYGTLKINVPADVADALTNGSCKYMGGLLLIDRQAYKDMEKQIEEIPATDASEVKHGKWEFRNDGAYGRTRCYCSACGKHSGIGGIRENQLKPFCPNCGAKMDEK